MEPEDARKAKIAVLHQEIDAIHFANQPYWQETAHSQQASAEDQYTQDRLGEIRVELTELGG